MTPKEKVYDAVNLINKVNDELRNTLIGVLKDCGGFIDTRACEEKPTLYAEVDTLGDDQTQVAIQAIRYDEDEGIFILTDTELDNYQFDTKYYFNYYFNFEGEDGERLTDVQKDIKYFRELDDGYTNTTATIRNILLGLAAYLD